MVRCPYCDSECVLHDIKEEEDHSGSTLGTLLGIGLGTALGGIPGAIFGAVGGNILGSLFNKKVYKCTNCGRTFDSIEEIERIRCNLD